MIPYFEPPYLAIGRFQFSAFSLLLTAAFLLGIWMILRRAERFQLQIELMWRMCFWAVGIGLIGAHVAKLAMEFTDQLLADPMLLVQRGGIRSLGGLVGGLLGAVAYGRFRGVSFFETFRLLDTIAFVLPVCWMIGRLGCALAHDHRGHYTESWIGVRFPEGTRFDLGLIEFLFLIAFSALFFWLDRKPRPVGFFFGLFGFGYGAFRVWLDTLHTQPHRFWGGLFGCLVGMAGWRAMKAYEGRKGISRPAEGLAP